MASSTATTLPFTVGDIILINAKESYMVSIHGEIHDLFLELNALLGKIIRATA